MPKGVRVGGTANERLERKRAYARAYSRRTRESRREYKRAWSRAHTHDRHLREKYGLSPLGYQAMLLAQGGGCAICHTTQPGGGNTKFAVDHIKGTKIVRGLLCSGHNLGLGVFGDSPDLLRKAADYLEKHNGK